MTDLKNVSAEEWRVRAEYHRACAAGLVNMAAYYTHTAAAEYAERMEKEAKGREACARGDHQPSIGFDPARFIAPSMTAVCSVCGKRVPPDPKPTRADVEAALRACTPDATEADHEAADRVEREMIRDWAKGRGLL